MNRKNITKAPIIKNYMKNYLYSLLLLLCASSAFPQNNKDAVLWSTVGIEKKINERLSADFEQQFRFIENYSYLNNAFSELSVSYKITKEFKVSGSFRLSNRFDERLGYYMRNRFNIDASYRLKINKISLSFRTRLQNTFDSRGYRSNAFYNRNKIAIGYSLNNFINPSVFTDLYSPLNLGSDAAGVIDRYRLGISNDLKANKKFTVSTAFIFQKEVGVTNPQNDYILSVGLFYKL